MTQSANASLNSGKGEGKEKRDIVHDEHPVLHLAEMEGRTGFRGLFDNLFV